MRRRRRSIRSFVRATERDVGCPGRRPIEFREPTNDSRRRNRHSSTYGNPDTTEKEEGVSTPGVDELEFRKRVHQIDHSRRVFEAFDYWCVDRNHGWTKRARIRSEKRSDGPGGKRNSGERHTRSRIHNETTEPRQQQTSDRFFLSLARPGESNLPQGVPKAPWRHRILRGASSSAKPGRGSTAMRRAASQTAANLESRDPIIIVIYE